ncbi:hypothetical protein OEA41_000126 [Lepraria neglecta]|uniref:Uncharacterized protein n=1 Tax=Lepraria neglecta TaxID=209136 RepID=A0AAD9ZFN6_9LECA|nr:hypothetical protein OEA41_000126 [Lepraria neglecta]
MGRNSRGDSSTSVVPEGSEKPMFSFDNREQYFPLFCLAEAPDEVDAPDFRESDEKIRLKTLRLPLADALEFFISIETLTMTPSEVLQFDYPDADPPIVKLIPPGILFLLEPFTNPRNQEYRIATLAEARIKKREGLVTAVAAGWMDDPGRRVQGISHLRLD